MFYNYYDNYQYDSCISKGICSINPRTSSLREVLVMYLKLLAYYTIQLKHLGIKNNAAENIILDSLSGLMSNLESGNEQFYKILINLRTIITKSMYIYKKTCREKNLRPKEINSNIKLNKNLNISDLIQLGEKEFLLKLKSLTDKQKNLYEIIFLVLKSICINLVELKSFNIDDCCAYSEILYLLNTLNYPELSSEILLKKINRAIETDYCLNKKLYDIKQEKYGVQTEAQVSYSTRANKAILVTGTNIQELKNMLDAARNTDIDIYTHGEMIIAYTYPIFNTYPHLMGQFGKGLEHCLLDFAAFPGAILVAKHSLENIEYLYRGRLFTTDNFVPQGVIKIKENDYIPVINSALNAKGFKHGQIRESFAIGCSQDYFDEKMNCLIHNMHNYKRIIIIGTQEHTKELKAYFDNLIKCLDDRTVVISLSEKHNAKNFIHINSAPDFYMIYRIFDRIKDFAKKNGTEIVLFIAKCDKHTISNILNLKRLGLDRIYLSECTPISFNPALTRTLEEVFDIRKTTYVTQDIKLFE